jgi:hypothetical protein
VLDQRISLPAAVGLLVSDLNSEVSISYRVRSSDSSD